MDDGEKHPSGVCPLLFWKKLVLSPEQYRRPSAPRPGAACGLSCGWWTLLAVGMLLVGTGCGEQQVDEQDEQGVDAAQEAQSYDLVIVKAGQGEAFTATTDSTAGGAAAESSRLRAEDRGGVKARSELPTPAVASFPQGADPSDQLPVVLDPHGSFVIQVGAFADQAQAARLVRSLRGQGYPAYQIRRPAGGRAFRVRLGFFRTRADAERFGRYFRADQKMDYWVDRRRDAR